MQVRPSLRLYSRDNTGLNMADKKSQFIGIKREVTMNT